jgi:hypothetical protein
MRGAADRANAHSRRGSPPQGARERWINLFVGGHRAHVAALRAEHHGATTSAPRETGEQRQMAQAAEGRRVREEGDAVAGRAHGLDLAEDLARLEEQIDAARAESDLPATDAQTPGQDMALQRGGDEPRSAGGIERHPRAGPRSRQQRRVLRPP